MDIKQIIKSATADFKVQLNDTQLNQLERYFELLVEWNEKINLTAITDYEGIAIKHFLDSMMLLSVYDIEEGASVIDVGTGAGFPGVVLKIIRPDIKLTLLDSLNKRINFLNELTKDLGLEVTAIHSRAEDGAKPPLREAFSLATARAVAALPTLSEYCMPYVKVGGSFVAMKGPTAAEEIENARNAIKILGGDKPILTVKKLPNGDTRCFVTIKKISQTPPKYPRNSAKISKFPL